MTDRVVVIYGLVDPRTGELRYVGKSVRSARYRLYAHVLLARGVGHKRPVEAWICQVMRAGAMPEVFEIDRIPANEDWQSLERFWIAYFRFVGCNLTNLTDGGEGMHGHRRSPEHHARICAALRGKPGTRWTDERKAAASRQRTGRKTKKWSAEARARNSERQSGSKSHWLGVKGADHCRSLPVAIDGVTYVSQRVAAESIGVTRVTVQNWIKKGRAQRVAKSA